MALGGLGKLGGRLGGRMNLNDYPNMKHNMQYGLGKMGNSALSGAGTMAGGLAMKGMYNVLTGNGPIQRRRKAAAAGVPYPGPSGGGCGCSCKTSCAKKKKPTCKKPKPKPKLMMCSSAKPSSSRYKSSYGSSVIPYGGSKPRVAGRQYRRNTRVAGRQARRTNRQAARQQRRFNRRN